MKQREHKYIGFVPADMPRIEGMGMTKGFLSMGGKTASKGQKSQGSSDNDKSVYGTPIHSQQTAGILNQIGGRINSVQGEIQDMLSNININEAGKSVEFRQKVKEYETLLTEQSIIESQIGALNDYGQEVKMHDAKIKEQGSLNMLNLSSTGLGQSYIFTSDDFASRIHTIGDKMNYIKHEAFSIDQSGKIQFETLPTTFSQDGYVKQVAGFGNMVKGVMKEWDSVKWDSSSGIIFSSSGSNNKNAISMVNEMILSDNVSDEMRWHISQNGYRTLFEKANQYVALKDKSKFQYTDYISETINGVKVKSPSPNEKALYSSIETIMYGEKVAHDLLQEMQTAIKTYGENSEQVQKVREKALEEKIKYEEAKKTFDRLSASYANFYGMNKAMNNTKIFEQSTYSATTPSQGPKVEEKVPYINWFVAAATEKIPTDTKSEVLITVKDAKGKEQQISYTADAYQVPRGWDLAAKGKRVADLLPPLGKITGYLSDGTSINLQNIKGAEIIGAEVVVLRPKDGQEMKNVTRTTANQIYRTVYNKIEDYNLQKGNSVVTQAGATITNFEIPSPQEMVNLGFATNETEAVHVRNMIIKDMKGRGLYNNTTGRISTAVGVYRAEPEKVEVERFIRVNLEYDMDTFEDLSKKEKKIIEEQGGSSTMTSKSQVTKKENESDIGKSEITIVNKRTMVVDMPLEMFKTIYPDKHEKDELQHLQEDLSKFLP
jgi:hypothetical protein